VVGVWRSVGRRRRGIRRRFGDLCRPFVEGWGGDVSGKGVSGGSRDSKEGALGGGASSVVFDVKGIP
jgi:hypothetical protein